MTRWRNAVGLDAPESAVEVLNVLCDRGYGIANAYLRADGAALIDRLKKIPGRRIPLGRSKNTAPNSPAYDPAACHRHRVAMRARRRGDPAIARRRFRFQGGAPCGLAR